MSAPRTGEGGAFASLVERRHAPDPTLTPDPGRHRARALPPPPDHGQRPRPRLRRRDEQRRAAARAVPALGLARPGDDDGGGPDRPRLASEGGAAAALVQL